jgi:hypothetical protein
MLPGARWRRQASNMQSEAQKRLDKKFVPGVLARGRIVRTLGCRLLLVSVISPALGPIDRIDGAAYGNRRAMGDLSEVENLVDRGSELRRPEGPGVTAP